MSESAPDPADLSASELIEGYQEKRFSPVEVTQAVLKRIRDHGPAVNAFRLVDEESAMAAARDSETRWTKGAPVGLVDGVPTTIKDLLLTRGWSTLRGSKTISPDQTWEEDAPAVARLREHGAILIGKTTTPEFGWKGVTDSALTGITRNPWDTTRTPGGSSGGAAAAAALGMGALHVGTDGGGSIRIPAGFTGIFGHKPSFGRVPAYPLSPFGTVAHIGPMTRTVTDAALMLTVLSEPDRRDWFSLPYDSRDFRDEVDDGITGLTVAFSPDLGYAEVDDEVAERVAAAAKTFADLGANVEQVDPGFDDPLDCFQKHWYAGAANLLRTMTAEELELVEPGLRTVAKIGREYDILTYLQAINQRGTLGQHMCRFHERYDLLLTPSLAIPAFAAGQNIPDTGDPSRWTDWTPLSHPFNLTQQPACSVPCGFTSGGLPVGLQIVGPMHADALVLRAARAYEAACPFVMPPLPPAV